MLSLEAQMSQTGGHMTHQSWWAAAMNEIITIEVALAVKLQSVGF
jgi:hypothetical protein